MKKLFFLLAYVAISFFCAAQVKVSSFPSSATMPNNFEFQDILNKQRITAQDARKYYNAGIVSTPISYVPSLTGNTAYLNAFVKDPNSDVWFIDFTGKAMKMGSSAAAIRDTANIYNSDGVLINNRIVDCNNKNLVFDNANVLEVSDDTTTINSNTTIINAAEKLHIMSPKVNQQNIPIPGMVLTLIDDYTGECDFQKIPRSNWQAIGSQQEIDNKPRFKGGLVEAYDSIQLGGLLFDTREIYCDQTPTGGQLLLSGGKRDANDINFPLQLEEKYNTGLDVEHGVGLRFNSEDLGGNNSSQHSEIYNYDGEFGIKSSGSLYLKGSYINLDAVNNMYINAGGNGLGIGIPYGSVSLNNGLVDFQMGNSSGNNYNMQFKGGVGLNENFFKLSNYPRTRSDTSQIKNFLFTDTYGTVRSRSLADLKTALNVSGATASMGLSAVNGDVRLGGTTAAPATMLGDRVITMSNSQGSTPHGSLILREGLNGAMSDIRSNTNVPLVLSTQGGSGVALVFENSQNNTYDGILSSTTEFKVRADNKDISIFTNNSLYHDAKYHYTAVQSGSGGFIRNTAGVVTTNLDTSAFYITKGVDSLIFGRVNGYPSNNKYFKLSNYKNTRNDAGVPVNVLTTDVNGVVQSHPVSELSVGSYDITTTPVLTGRKFKGSNIYTMILNASNTTGFSLSGSSATMVYSELISLGSWTRILSAQPTYKAQGATFCAITASSTSSGNIYYTINVQIDPTQNFFTGEEIIIEFIR